MRLLGDVWTLIIVYTLLQGTKRFGELLTGQKKKALLPTLTAHPFQASNDGWFSTAFSRISMDVGYNYSKHE